MNVPNRRYPGLTRESSAVPATMPGARPITIGSTRRHTLLKGGTVDPQHVSVQRDLDENEGRIEDAIGQE